MSEVITRIVQPVGPAAGVADGSEVRPWYGRRGEATFQLGRSEYAEIAERGRYFLGSTPAAGVTVPIYSSTTQQLVLSNPLGSGRRLHIIKTTLGYISGTMVAGHFCYANNTLLGNAVTGTAALVQNAKLGAAAGPSGTVAQLFTAATVVALTYLKPIGWSQVVQAATATNTPWNLIDEVKGSIVVMPGSCLAIAANVAAAVVAAIGIEWEESDILGS